jgi:hypothetical protein
MTRLPHSVRVSLPLAGRSVGGDFLHAKKRFWGFRWRFWGTRRSQPTERLDNGSTIQPTERLGNGSVWLKSVCWGLLILLLIPAGCSKLTPESDKGAASTKPVIRRTTEKGPVRMNVRITPAEPRLSDLVEMEVEVTAESEVEIQPPAFGQAVGDFLVRNYSEKSPQSVSIADGKTIRVFRYQLEPVSTGTHLIRSVAVDFIDNRESSEAKGKLSQIASEPIEIKVTSELGDQVPDLAHLEPMLPPQPIDRLLTAWWSLVPLVVVAAILLFFWRRRQRATRIVQPVPPSPEEIAHAALARLLSEDLPSHGLFKEFYLRLTSIVRHYIEGTTGLHAPEQTTEEFLREIRLKEIFPADRSLRLKEFLEAADMVKYAGQQPGAEQIEMSILRAREFVGVSSDGTDVPSPFSPEFGGEGGRQAG